MRANVTATIGYRGDCGHEFRISAIGLDPEKDITCPTCGAVDRMDAEQCAEVRRELDAVITKRGTEALAGQVDNMLRDIAARHKGVSYRSNR